jgi:hypothetical protein
MQVKGKFEVASQSEPPYDTVEGVVLGRASVDKRFSGPLEGTGKVHMLGVRTPGQSAAYVALERITGKLEARSGSFVVTHVGGMSKTGMSLTIAIVPDTGTGELAGIRGSIQIEIIEGQHFYELNYELPSG